MKLNKVNGVYDEASKLYINAIVNRHNCTVSEAIEYIENEEDKSKTKVNPQTDTLRTEAQTRFKRATSESDS